jgi:hypothetical protein
MLKDYSLNRILVLLVTVGFVFLTVDSTIEHWDILLKDAVSWIPLIFGIAGAVAGFVTVMSWEEKWIRTFHITLIVSILVGGTGFFFHVREDEDELKEGTRTEQEQKEKDKPLLAPFAFAGLAAFGLAGTARKWQSEIKPS